MSDLFVRNLPSIREREFKYRAPMSSAKLNEMQQEAFNDILDLFNKANQLQKTIYEMNLANNIESVCYGKRLEAAVSSLNKLTEMYHNLTSDEKDFRTITRYAFEASTMDEDRKSVV